MQRTNTDVLAEVMKRLDVTMAHTENSMYPGIAQVAGILVPAFTTILEALAPLLKALLDKIDALEENQ